MNEETKTIEAVVDAEVVEPNKTVEVVVRKQPFITESGDVNLSALTPQQIEKCRVITKNLNPKVIGSVSNYGVELQSRLADSGKSFLTTAKTSRSGEVGNIMQDLVSTLDLINIKDLEEPNSVIKVLQKIPIINNFVPSIKKVMRKYDTIEESIKTIESNIQATQMMAIADNNALQQMFDDNKTYLQQLEDIIVAGTLAVEDSKSTLSNLISEGADNILISDQENFITSLEKKIHDLKAVRQIAKHNLLQIRIIQRNNIMSADNAQSMIALTIPAFRSQMALAVALQHQGDGLKVQKTVRDKTDSLIKANAEALYHNSVEVTKAAN